MSARVSAGGRKAVRRKSPVSRTAELAKKRERRSFRFRLVTFGAVLLALLLAATYHFWLRDSSFVEIRNLEVVGVTDKTVEGKQIQEAVRTAMGEMTTLNVKSEVLDEELSRFPRVAGAEIETSFPDTATVTLDIRKNGSIYGEGSGALLIATDGTVLGPAAGQEDALPLIGEGDPPKVAADGNGNEGGTETLTGRALTQALILGAAPPEIRSYIDRTTVTPDGVLVTFDNGPEMLFGDSTHAEEKWRAAVALIADPNFDTDSYVDLSVPRRPAVSDGPTEETTAEESSEGPVGIPSEG